MKLDLKERAFGELDSLRFVAVSMVVIHHQYFKTNAFFRWFDNYGLYGVDVFFVISGFIITLGLLRESAKTGSVSLKNFWMRRILRLWPTWAIALLCSIGVIWALGTKDPSLHQGLLDKLWHYIFHVGNYSIAYVGKIHNILVHFWTLAVEEHFYVIWPVLFTLTLKNRNLRLSVLALAILLPYVFRILHGLADPENSHHIIYFSTHTRFDGLAYGCLLACFFQKERILSAKLEACLVGLFFVFGYLGLYGLESNSLPMALQQLDYTCISLASCVLVLIALNGNPRGPRRLLRFRSLSKLGLLSYGVYLFHPHWNVLYFFVINKLGMGAEYNVISAVINFIAPYIPAYFLYMTVEKYFEKKKQAFRSSEPLGSGDPR